MLWLNARNISGLGTGTRLRRCHNPRLTNHFSVLLQSNDLHHHSYCIIYEEESRVYT